MLHYKHKLRELHHKWLHRYHAVTGHALEAGAAAAGHYGSETLAFVCAALAALIFLIAVILNLPD